MVAGPRGAVNFDLVKIVNRPAAANGGFPVFTTGEAAAASFLGRDPDIIGVCDPSAPTCDVRKAYHEDYAGTNWANILTRLGEPAKAACALPTPGSPRSNVRRPARNCSSRSGGATRSRSTSVRRACKHRSSAEPRSQRWSTSRSSPTRSKTPSSPLRTATRRPTCSTSSGPPIKAGALIPGGSNYAAALGGAFAVAAYLSKPNGSPDLIGPRVTTRAANLGSDLYDRYAAASAYFTTEAKIIMSDGTKMSEVAALVNSAKWKLDDIPRMTERVRLATKQTIYQALIPTAYPMLYDLTGSVYSAKDWYCDGGFAYDKHLFQNTDGGANLTFVMTDPRYLGQRHVIAVGARDTVGTLHSAYVPAPPDSLTVPLFRSPDSPQGGGIGLYKLQFYSPQNFEMFPRVLLNRVACSSVPDPPGNSG